MEGKNTLCAWVYLVLLNGWFHNLHMHNSLGTTDIYNKKNYLMTKITQVCVQPSNYKYCFYICNNTYVLIICMFSYSTCAKKIIELIKYKSILPVAFPIQKDNDLICQSQWKIILHPNHVTVLNCVLYTLGFLSVMPKKTKINIKLLTPNINKRCLQLKTDKLEC